MHLMPMAPARRVADAGERPLPASDYRRQDGSSYSGIGNDFGRLFEQSQGAVFLVGDPDEYRLGLLKDSPRARAVLQLAAEKLGWGH
jgi:hypothetical protein